jgi:hypothetical protein
MKYSVCLLLPAISAEEINVFDGLPGESLLVPGNLPTLAQHDKPVLYILASSAAARRFEQSRHIDALGQQAEIRIIRIDEIVLDYPFDVVPSLAYMRGIREAGNQPASTAFVFLQPNLVLGDGALRSVAKHLEQGARVLTATYLHADRNRLSEALGGAEGIGALLSPRNLTGRALDCLDAQDLVSVINTRLPLYAPTGRFYWKTSASTLLSHDFMPSLVCLRPSREPCETRGFRDVSFAASMCPNSPPYFFSDSDEFLGIELTDLGPEPKIFLGWRSLRGTANDLSNLTTAPQRAAAVQSAWFYATDSQTRSAHLVTQAQQHIKQVIKSLGPPRSELDDPRWKLSFYLWGVRRFELGHGQLPHPPFEELLWSKEARTTSSSEAGAVDIVGKFARRTREFLFGRAPLVTFLHPEWLEYRPVIPTLRAVVRKTTSKVLYIGDGVAVLGRTLGPPNFTSSGILDGTYDRKRFGVCTLDLVIIELSAEALCSWSALVSKLYSLVKPRGRIVVFHRIKGFYPGPTLGAVLSSGLQELGAHVTKRITISLNANDQFRTWLQSGYQIALDFLRLRRPVSIIKGLSLVSILTGMSTVQNLLNLKPREIKTSSGFTIVIEI